ncbi:adenylate/guanylate cyclase domain-containing protein [Granulosicoccus antarcticus]|uniref:Adenylate cyclase 1 n=1 Tax=Granulosicoccus antarcticus IMCC3135 TaxID=1192854 RepID=A0A2Z2NT77_9GAMM|nr:adenylate/guanylate cyclase domain-containing protein [Granulosicoccus antarcticus]ASJ70807.1 Adenylate cyclase 1 [Granulosicoccus antarcticus IMCC3135]
MFEKTSESVHRKLLSLFKSKQAWLFNWQQSTEELPESIQIAIEKQQNSSERLISWIQIAILVVFAILYTMAPNTLPIGSDFEPVPLFLGAYFIFTCLRLYFSYISRLAYWVLVLSVLVDMGLLLGLIWSFHLQYMQPPSFYLKSPTLLYIFIFISLRALRFEPGLVLLSGLVGAAGWLILMILAITDHSGGSVITRDYVVYLTSNSVLIGGELDKMISILVVTAILTLAIARGRQLLIRSIVEARTAESLSRFVPEGVAAQIANTQGPLINAQTESCEASILFVDLISFTSLAERLPPEKLITTLNEYFHVISEPIERNHGVINQFQGDAILASFNLPTKDANHANSAVRAALEIQEILSTYRFEGGIRLSTRAGINTGTVVGGFIGTSDRLSYTVYGDNVNIASRLQVLSKQYNSTNLVSLRTMQLCDDHTFHFREKGRGILRGRSSPVMLYEAVRTHN